MAFSLNPLGQSVKGHLTVGEQSVTVAIALRGCSQAWPSL